MDFVCIISAIDTRIELEVMQKETKFKIKDFENSAKILPLTKSLTYFFRKLNQLQAKNPMLVVRMLMPAM